MRTKQMECKRVGVYSIEPHAHQCGKCGLVWSHDPTQIREQQQFDDSHHCPNCQTEVRKTYDGTERIDCEWDGSTQTWLDGTDCHVKVDKSAEHKQFLMNLMRFAA